MKFFISFILIFLAFACWGETQHYWIQPDSSITGGAGAQIKGDVYSGKYSLNLHRYHTPGKGIIDGVVDKDTGQSVTPRYNTISVLKLWSAHFNKGYLDFGLGMGVGKGTWGEDCEESEGFFNDKHCRIVEGEQLGLPWQASAVFGKYVGIGFSITGFLTHTHSHVTGGITIPLGVFTN